MQNGGQIRTDRSLQKVNKVKKLTAMADAGVKQPKQEQKQPTLVEVSYDDEEVALVAAATQPAVEDDPAEEVDLVLPADAEEEKSEAQVNGIMVLGLLDKIIGVVDQIQQTQQGLESRQEAMEKSVSCIQGDLAKLSKSHVGTATTVNKMLEKVRKVSVNVKTVRSNLEKQAGQIKKLESNEHELLKRRNFKVLITQEEPPKESKAKTEEPAVAEGVAVEGLQQIPEEGGEGAVNSDEEVEIEEIVEESRAQRIKRSGKERVDNIKKAFSKEKMEKNRIKTREKIEKAKQKSRDKMEKTRLKTRENLEKTKHSLGAQMGKLSTRMTPNQERKEKLKTSTENIKKSLTPDHTVHARSKTAVYRVPPFTFHVKKIRDGEEVVLQNTVEVAEIERLPQAEEDGQVGLHAEVAEGELVRVDSPEMEALLEVVEDSKLVLVDTGHVTK